MLTSATLAVSGGFDYIRKRVGVDHAREMVVPSHYDYNAQAVFYVPPELPDPRQPQFAQMATEKIRRILECTDAGEYDDVSRARPPARRQRLPPVSLAYLTSAGPGP